MSMYKYNLNDTIAAISTPLGKSGIGIVRISGRKALKIADRIFLAKDGKKPSQFSSFTIHYGQIVENQKSKIGNQRFIRGKPQVIDEVLLTVMRTPRTYTREDIVEINCHGGIVPLRKVLELVLKQGARLAQPGEFTLRAFLNGRIDLTQAEAVLDVINAKTEKSLEIACQQLEGKFSEKIRELKDLVSNIYAEMEASIDFPDEDLDLQGMEFWLRGIKNIVREISALLKSSDKGLIFKEGISVVICGKPNVGKSSLMNILLKKNRCLVSSIPGTTRDIIEEWVNIEGIPLKLVDTAGITEAKNILDREAIKKSKDYLKIAELIIFILDGSRKITPEDFEIFKLIEKKPKIILINKIDLPQKISEKELKRFSSGKILKISCLTGEAIEKLYKEIKRLVLGGEVLDSEGYLVTNLRHKELLVKTREFLNKVKEGLCKKLSLELVILDLKEAVESLRTILGETTSEDILDRIFSQFCIGK